MKNTVQVSEDERIDIVNEYDQVVKTVWRSEVSGKHVPYLRAVYAPFINQKGQLCILRRALHKKVGPGHWSFVGGGVQHGEPYEEAFKREVQEESGVDVSCFQWKYLGLIHPHEGNGIHFLAVYQVEIEEKHMMLNEEDFCDFYWINPSGYYASIGLHKESFDPNAFTILSRFFT